MRRCAPGRCLARCSRLAAALNRISLTSVDLPEPETPVTQQNVPSGIFDVDVLEVVLRGALDLDVAGRAAGASSAPAIERLPDEVLPGRRGAHLHHLLGRALGDQLAAVLAGARTEVDQVVGRAHRVLVVLDDDHGVAEVAQALQRRDQPLVVALVQADRRLVEDVEHAHQARADLRRQPDPLRLAARERRRRAVERQVADADVVEEAQPLLDLAQDQPRDLALGARQLELLQPLDRPPRRHARELVDAEPADLHRQRLRPQPRAVALRARPQRHVLLDLLARVVRLGLAVAALEVRHDALEGRHVRAPAPVAVAVRDVELVAVGAVAGSSAGRPRRGPPTGRPCPPPTSRRSPASSARSSSRPWSTTAGSRRR